MLALNVNFCYLNLHCSISNQAYFKSMYNLFWIRTTLLSNLRFQTFKGKEGCRKVLNRALCWDHSNRSLLALQPLASYLTEFSLPTCKIRIRIHFQGLLRKRVNAHIVLRTMIHTGFYT